MNILDKIVAERKKSLAKDRALVRGLPARTLPLVPFFQASRPFIIAEFKKASPASGRISSCAYTKLAEDYYRSGARRFSVLTERKYFKGSLQDLYELKKQYPRCAFLRKDFLFCDEDIIHAYRAGADAVLLIAEILSAEDLQNLITRARYLGMQVLGEAHSLEAVQKILSLRELPDAIGLNSRDLKDFAVRPDRPLRLKPYIPPSLPVVYESGVREEYLLELIGNAGFAAALIGEAAVKAEKRVKILRKFRRALHVGSRQRPNYFTKLYARRRRVLVKMCGMTNRTDVLAAVKAGADAVGFILTPRSPRHVADGLLRAVRDIKILKVAVVENPGWRLLRRLRGWLRRGLLDAVQFHGQEPVELVYSFRGGAYKATTDTALRILPVTLYDAEKTISLRRGRQIAGQAAGAVRGQWLAGGLNPRNVRKLIRKLEPGLVDVCSGIEQGPGIKNKQKLIDFVQEVARA